MIFLYLTEKQATKHNYRLTFNDSGMYLPTLPHPARREYKYIEN